MSSYDYLGLPGILTTKVEESDDRIVVEAETVEPRFPICCLAQQLVRNGERAHRRMINDTAHGGKPLLIMMRIRRAKCRGCGKQGIEETLPSIRPNRHMTERLYQHIAIEGLQGANTKASRRVYVSEGTVRSVLNEFIAEKLAKLEPVTPRVLGLDEKMLSRSYRAVLGNVEAGTILDLLPDRDGSVEHYLKEVIDRSKVEVFCTDMYAPYRRLWRRYLPRSVHVVDKFHVQKKATDTLDRFRNAYMKGEDEATRKRLRKTKKLFLMRAERMPDWAHAMLRKIEQQHPVLGKAYWAKERYFDLYRCTSVDEAVTYYSNWMDTLDPEIRGVFEPGCSILDDIYPAVFGYFELPMPSFTNAYVEGVNRVLQDLNSVGRGYSFEMIRGKLLLAPALHARVFRERHPGAFAYTPDIGMGSRLEDSSFLGTGIVRAYQALEQRSRRYTMVDGKYQLITETSGLGTIHCDLELAG